MKIGYLSLIAVVVISATIVSSSIPNLIFPTSGQEEKDFETYYNHYGAGLFDRGIHVISTTSNPSRPDQSIDWEFLKSKETTSASSEDFMSIVISRGDFPTGGYTIHIISFSWLESYPVKLRFQANFTDPGEGVAVTEAFTNPTVLIPIGKLAAGEYIAEVSITSYILTYDENGNPVYTPIMTFKEEVWRIAFTIT